ncbi:hypothetical protein BKA81DRAFT_359037 [Phyllosticta paracitricarpa]
MIALKISWSCLAGFLQASSCNGVLSRPLCPVTPLISSPRCWRQQYRNRRHHLTARASPSPPGPSSLGWPPVLEASSRPVYVSQIVLPFLRLH